jgi:hypothetical protein
MFTHLLSPHYSSPDGFDWEDNHSPVIDADNVAERSQVLLSIL